jgi:hypothetical protein
VGARVDAGICWVGGLSRRLIASGHFMHASMALPAEVQLVMINGWVGGVCQTATSASHQWQFTGLMCVFGMVQAFCIAALGNRRQCLLGSELFANMSGDPLWWPATTLTVTRGEEWSVGSGSASSPALWLQQAGRLFHYPVQAYLHAFDGCAPCTLERVFDWEQCASFSRGSAAAVASFAVFWLLCSCFFFAGHECLLLFGCLRRIGCP